MKPFWAIVKLTLRNCVRSHLFQLLLFLLLLCVVLIPSTISGDGTAGGFIRISLLYSLSAVSTILALSSIWLGCFVMAQDIDNYQLHMVVTKPVSRVKIWLAKWDRHQYIAFVFAAGFGFGDLFHHHGQVQSAEFPGERAGKDPPMKYWWGGGCSGRTVPIMMSRAGGWSRSGSRSANSAALQWTAVRKRRTICCVMRAGR